MLLTVCLALAVVSCGSPPAIQGTLIPAPPAGETVPQASEAEQVYEPEQEPDPSAGIIEIADLQDEDGIEEIEEIEDLREITRIGTLDDIKINCYEKMHQLLYQEKRMEEFSMEELMEILMQMRYCISFIDSMANIKIDTKSLNTSYKKIETLFQNELSQRNI
jgi:hypothetical protein